MTCMKQSLTRQEIVLYRQRGREREQCKKERIDFLFGTSKEKELTKTAALLNSSMEAVNLNNPQPSPPPAYSVFSFTYRVTTR